MAIVETRQAIASAAGDGACRPWGEDVRPIEVLLVEEMVCNSAHAMGLLQAPDTQRCGGQRNGQRARPALRCARTRYAWAPPAKPPGFGRFRFARA